VITFNDLLGNNSISDVPLDYQQNLEDIKNKVNALLDLFNLSMLLPVITHNNVDSGFRTMDEHLRIYAEKGITDINHIPMRSHHLTGEAADIGDPAKLLQKWCISNLKTLESIGLWCESFMSTPTWVHFQTKPPASGKRFFIP
jgi:hypothetical protein